MANRAHPTPHDADNNAGSLPAARIDWREGDADSMSARDLTISPQMPDIRLQAKSPEAFNLECSFYLREESIYEGLGRSAGSRVRIVPMKVLNGHPDCARPTLVPKSIVAHQLLRRTFLRGLIAQRRLGCVHLLHISIVVGLRFSAGFSTRETSFAFSDHGLILCESKGQPVTRSLPVPSEQ